MMTKLHENYNIMLMRKIQCVTITTSVSLDHKTPECYSEPFTDTKSFVKSKLTLWQLLINKIRKFVHQFRPDFSIGFEAGI